MSQSSRNYLLFFRDFTPLSFVVTHFRQGRVVLRGKELVILSPFTRERTPSLYVVDKKLFYIDFSSGMRGDVLSYLICAEKFALRDAVRFLQKETGLVFIPEKYRRKRPKRRRTRQRGI